LSDPRPFPKANASFIITKENKDFIYNRIIRDDYPIHTKHFNYTGRLLLGPSRLEVPDFLNTIEIESMEKLFHTFKDDFHQEGPGYDMFSMLKVISSSTFPALRSYTSKSSSSSSQNLFSQLSPHRIHQLKFWLHIVDRITEAAESFFDTRVATDNIFIARRAAESYQIIEYPGCNITRWVHQPHVDQCTMVIDPINGVRCEMRKTGLPIEYSAVLYLNELQAGGGGELVFLDMIQGKEGLLHSSSSSSHTSHLKGNVNTTLSHNAKSTRSSNHTTASSTTASKVTSKSPLKYKDYMKPVKYETIVSPGYGKLFLFSTTPENAHGIREIQKGSSDRHTMVIFFVRKELAETWHQMKAGLVPH